MSGPILLTAAGIVLLWWSWGRWPDPLVDFGRELYVPWRMAAGQRLYADIAYFNGPLSPALNALLFRLFGASLRTLVLANIAILAAIAALLYGLLSRIGGRVAATAGVSVFLAVFACAQYMEQGNYNYITPYSHEMTHGVALSLAALALLGVHLRRGDAWSLLGCGAAAGLTFLTKAEFFVALAPAVIAGLALGWRDDAPASPAPAGRRPPRSWPPARSSRSPRPAPSSWPISRRARRCARWPVPGPTC